jgi:4-hydroxythreonine-4-phosphate dehydrogenase
MLPRIAITAGDPAGIGPEIAEKAAADPRVLELCQPIVYATNTAADVYPGAVSATAGRAAYDAIVRAVGDARAGRVEAIATAPINKLAFARAGLRWKGHTDLLAELCGSPRVAMMFHAPGAHLRSESGAASYGGQAPGTPGLKVVLATVHVPLADVPRLLTQELLQHTIELTAQWLPRFGIERPRIAVAGLNPHAGEDGLIGLEDRDVIQPAVLASAERGLTVSGPFPADTVFVRATRGEFDVVVACYHDQGLIPVKLLGFGRAVNVTIGLPIIRTSVDHGTAFDIAGRGIADPGSMIEAIVLAAQLAGSRSAAA